MLEGIVYLSIAAMPLDPGSLEQLLASSRKANERFGISGQLILCDGRFLQLLEGEQDVVRGLYSRICADTRHRSVRVLRHSMLARRLCPSWRMAHCDAAMLSAEEQAAIRGLIAALEERRAAVPPLPRSAMLTRIGAITKALGGAHPKSTGHPGQP